MRSWLLVALVAGCGAPAVGADAAVDSGDARVDLAADLHYGCFSSSVTTPCAFAWPPPASCAAGTPACEQCGAPETLLCYCLEPEGTWLCGCPDDSNVPAPDYCAMSHLDGDPCCGRVGHTTTCDDPIAGTRCSCVSHHWSCVTLAIDAGTD
jgi:hypothetical protein